MARQHKKTSGKVAANPIDRRHNVEQLIEKGKLKEAFKVAKLYFHQQPSLENRQLVEQTYLLRIESLIRDGMTSAAREVATSMLEFGVEDPERKRALVFLLPQVGLISQAIAIQEQSQSPELKEQLDLKLADRAILHPEEIPPSYSHLNGAATLVRSALAAIDSDNETQALELLHSIPRSSPLADWRFFVRGLIAFRKNDLDHAKANWERLDPQRTACKITRVLLSNSKSETAGGQQNDLKVLESSVFGEPVLGRIAELRTAIEANDWKRALRIIGPLKNSLARIDPRYAVRLTEIVLMPLAEEIKRRHYSASQQLIEDSKAVLEPLPWDPQWNRFEALLWEGEQGDPEEAIRFWQKYLNDLEQGAASQLGESRRIQALVWRRIGEITSDLAAEEPDEFEEDSKRSRKSDNLRAQAVAALQKSLDLDPTQRKSHQLLIDNYISWDQHDSLISALEKFTIAFPDDVDVLRMLINRYLDRDDPEPALKCVLRLRILRPLDTQVDMYEAPCRIQHARHLALRGRWDEGRAEFTRAETLLNDEAFAYRQLSRRAIFEYKAGNLPGAEEYVSRARSTLKEPTALWLGLAIDSVRYKVTGELESRFNRDFQEALKRKPTSETAGELAELMAGFIKMPIKYDGHKSHVQAITDYLGRTRRLKYHEADLRSVCALLQLDDLDEKLLQVLVKRGLKLFPRSPFFLVIEAQIEMEKGPFACNLQQVRSTLKRALSLAELSQDSGDLESIPKIKEFLVHVESAGEAMASLPFIPGGMPSSREEFMDMFEAMFDEFGEEDDSEIEDDKPQTNRSKQTPKRKPR